MNLRFRRVRGEIDALESEDVVLGVFAVLEWVFARHGQRAVGVWGDVGGGAPEGFGGGGGGQQGGGEGEELHGGKGWLRGCMGGGVVVW